MSVKTVSKQECLGTTYNKPPLQQNSVLPSFATLLKFSRPHTVIHTTFCPWIISLVMISFAKNNNVPYDLFYFYSNVAGVCLAFLFINIFIVGINQIYDLEIDKINKPDLPLASGKMTVSTAWAVLGTVLTLGFACIASISPTPLVFGSWLYVLALGTAYSVPPIRLKQSSLWVSYSIMTCRGLVFPLSVIFHLAHVLGLTQRVTTIPAVPFIVMFSLLWALAISIFKDIPDTVGDMKEGIQTIPVILGSQNAFVLCLAIMYTAWCTSTGVALWMGGLSASTSIIKLSAHCFYRLAVGGGLAYHSSNCMARDFVTKTGVGHMSSFYKTFVWGLFYLEWALLPLWF